MTGGSHGRIPLWVLVVVAVVVVVTGLGALLLLSGKSLPAQTGPPVEKLSVERTLLSSSNIELTVRNNGPDVVRVAQIFVNDVYVSFSGATNPLGRRGSDTLRINFPWQDGQPYRVSILTSTGAVIEHQIPAATATPPTNRELLGLMALLGTYVGIVPVLLGMAFLPAIGRVGRSKVRVLLALTVGLLIFLAVDASLAAFELSRESESAFGGPMLVFLGAGLAFLALTAVDEFMRSGSEAWIATEPDGRRLALMIAIGIGLHNLGEGLAIGSAYAVGELAFGAALVVGFALHNTTEGLAVVTPLTAQRPSLVRLVGLGLIAGAPAIVGAIVGAAVTTVELSLLLLGLGIGATIQVVIQIAPAQRAPTGRILNPATASGVAAGLAIMYASGLFVAA